MNQVEAVKTKKQRDQVEAHLQQAGRIYYDIWKLGLNTALRISDLLVLTMADVKRLDTKSPVLEIKEIKTCLLYTSPSPRDRQKSRMPSSA